MSRVSMTSIPDHKRAARREMQLALDEFEMAGGQITVLPNGMTGERSPTEKITKAEAQDLFRQRPIKQQKIRAEKVEIRKRTRPLQNTLGGKP